MAGQKLHRAGIPRPALLLPHAQRRQCFRRLLSRLRRDAPPDGLLPRLRTPGHQTPGRLRRCENEVPCELHSRLSRKEQRGGQPVFRNVLRASQGFQHGAAREGRPADLRHPRRDHCISSEHRSQSQNPCCSCRFLPLLSFCFTRAGPEPASAPNLPPLFRKQQEAPSMQLASCLFRTLETTGPVFRCPRDRMSASVHVL